MKNTLKTGIVITLIILTSCQTIPESEGNINLNFCSITNCTEIIIENINNTNNTLCAFFTMDNDKLIKTLEKNKASIIIDENEKTKIKSYIRKGAGLMHDKFCVINNNKTIIGSYNPTNSANDDYNNMLIIESKPIANFYKEIHESIIKKKNQKSKNNKFIHNNKLIEIYACPQDNCQKQIIKEIEKSEKEIIIALFTFTDKEISNTIIKKIRNNISVKGIIESFQQPKYNQYFPLKKAGAEIKLEKTKRLQHNKIFIIDNKTIITGSYNPTNAANTINNENIIILHDEKIAKIYAKYVMEYLIKTK